MRGGVSGCIYIFCEFLHLTHVRLCVITHSSMCNYFNLLALDRVCVLPNNRVCYITATRVCCLTTNRVCCVATNREDATPRNCRTKIDQPNILRWIIEFVSFTLIACSFYFIYLISLYKQRPKSICRSATPPLLHCRASYSWNPGVNCSDMLLGRGTFNYYALLCDPIPDRVVLTFLLIMANQLITLNSIL